jgi:Sulfotransferase domain
LPTYRFSKTVDLIRGVRAFLGIETGATRGNTPDDIRRKQAQRLEAARQTTKETRRQLRQKERRRRGQAQRLEVARQTIKETRRQLRQEERRRRGQARRLEVARQTIKKTRRQLARREKQLERREVRNSYIEGPGSTGNAALGALPDFLIIGTEKGGTTFLYWKLCQHPYVEPAHEKELHFFDTRLWFKKGVGWYRSQFPAPAWRDGRKVITGEASPYYLFHPFSPRRASNLLPDAKLIALLRNPVDRAYSAYNDKVSTGHESLSFEAALAEEENRTAGELEKMLSDERYYSRNLRVYSYLSRGIYLDQLQRWYEHFNPDQLLVLKSEALFADPDGSVERVHEFLDLPKSDTNITLPTEERNSRSYSPMAPSIRERLEQFFEPHNQRLYEYLGVDFGW